MQQLSIFIKQVASSRSAQEKNVKRTDARTLISVISTRSTHILAHIGDGILGTDYKVRCSLWYAITR